MSERQIRVFELKRRNVGRTNQINGSQSIVKYVSIPVNQSVTYFFMK